MNNLEQKNERGATHQVNPSARRGLKASRAEFLRLWNDPTLSTEEIGRHLNITQACVSKRAKARGLPPRGSLHRFQIRDTQTFREMWIAGVMIDDMARHFGVFTSTIKRTRLRLGLAPRGKGRGHLSVTLDQFLHDRLARQMAATAAMEQLMMLDAGCIALSHTVLATIRRCEALHS